MRRPSARTRNLLISVGLVLAAVTGIVISDSPRPRVFSESRAGTSPLVPVRTWIRLPVSFKYLQPGYHHTPGYARVGVAAAPDGTVRVAWQGPDGVHVTALGPTMRRSGPDTVVRGSTEVGGLVAHDDGFALLTRRPDRNTRHETAAHLVRFRGTEQAWSAPLTRAKDTSPVLAGALAWNGEKYGAYFVVHGATGRYGDRLTYTTAAGVKLKGGWTWGCSRDVGLALAPAPSGPFASVCVDDQRSGVLLSTGVGAPADAPVIQREQCRAGHCGASIGGLVRSPSGPWAVAFGSRGATSAKPAADGRGWTVTPATATHQIALRLLRTKSRPMARTIYLTDDPSVDHVNIKIAPYGEQHFLLSWQTLAKPTCRSGTCTGRFTGTHLRLVTLSGAWSGPETITKAHIDGDMATLPDGSLVWVSAPNPPLYSSPLTASPATRRLNVYHLYP
jgi:hypothetical protein